MNKQHCASCLFCKEINSNYIRCTNADITQDNKWQNIYITHGYFDLPPTYSDQKPCFWFVQKK